MRLPRLATFAVLLAAHVVSATTREYSGEIDGALYKVLAPADWNGSLWIEAHGHRGEESPLLAELSEAHPFNTALLARGWAIATTSYRRNGYIVDDAITDLANLRAEVTTKLGSPKLVIIEGSSMGGGIGAIIAESARAKEFADGIVAAGAALQVVDAQLTRLRLTHAPRIPIVFLTNQSEITGPEAYVAAARSLAAPGAVQPVLWRVLRDGHVNVNAPERLAALDAVAQWAVTGVSPGDRDDATIEVDAGSSSAVIVAPDGSLRATVRDLARVYGNLFTDLRPADLERLGVAQGESFTLTAPGGTFTVFYGTTYTDVPQGGWIAFPTAEGTVMIARNRGNAAEAANLATGDTFAVAKAR
jgi:hypothetical protein